MPSLDLSGLDVLLDCANGATYRVAPEIFRRFGANVTALADAPDGRNINADCGSTHVERLAERVVAGGHALGFAFDGDGDRVLAVDGAGAIVDGDELMALAALHLREAGRLRGGGVVVTVMTNYGFHTAMAQAGIEVASAKVGDRYVLEELLARGWTFGGEQSGHLIELGFNRTGDGIAGALLTLEALVGADLRERHAMAKLPQRLVNVRVRDREALHGSEAVSGRRRGRGRGAQRARARAGESERDRAAGAGDGRGADRHGGPGGLRPVGWTRATRACLKCLCVQFARTRAETADIFERCVGSSATSVDALPVSLLLGGLRRLEYRGYDSAGISTIEDGRIESVRAVGNLGALRVKLDGEAAEAQTQGGGGRSRRSRPRPASVIRAGRHMDG